MNIRSARRAVAIAAIAGGLLVAMAATAVAGEDSGGGANSNAAEKVTICHRTNSDKHPYVEKSVAAKGVLKGHGGHHAAKSVWSPGMKAKHQKWGDIVPAFDAGGKHFDGLNLDTKGGADGDTSGQSILDAHCQIS